MKKVLGISVLAAMACAFFGCAENGLECNENTFVDRCIGNEYLEICTYDERARLKCPNECIVKDDGPDVCE